MHLETHYYEDMACTVCHIFKHILVMQIASLVKSAAVDNWDVIFNTLVQYEPDRRKLIVFDEFQYIGKSQRGLIEYFSVTGFFEETKE